MHAQQTPQSSASSTALRPPATHVRRIGSLVLTSAIAMALLPALPAAARTPSTPQERVLALAEAAAEPDAPRLFDLLPMAAGTEDAAAETDVVPATVTLELPTYHRLAAGETLADVAQQRGITGDDGWRRLFDANPTIENPDVVEVGTRVRIPEADEVLAARELPAPPPPRPSASTSRAGGGGGAVWDRLASCEAGGNWAANTGNGYYGGLQFSASSWAAVGGTGLPHQQSRATQIAMGQRLQAAAGWGSWPSCSRKLGLR